MKTILISVAVLATAMLFWFCKQQPKYTPDAFPEKQLRWGSGGGFVGKETKFTLLENGQVFKDEPNKKTVELENTKVRKAKALFKTATELDLLKLDFQHPGNTYDFMECQEGEEIKRITWGDSQFPVDPKIKEMFAALQALAK